MDEIQVPDPRPGIGGEEFQIMIDKDWFNASRALDWNTYSVEMTLEQVVKLFGGYMTYEELGKLCETWVREERPNINELLGDEHDWQDILMEKIAKSNELTSTEEEEKSE